MDTLFAARRSLNIVAMICNRFFTDVVAEM